MILKTRKLLPIIGKTLHTRMSQITLRALIRRDIKKKVRQGFHSIAKPKRPSALRKPFAIQDEKTKVKK